MTTPTDAIDAFERRDPAAFDRVVDGILAALPEWVLQQIDNLHVVVQDCPTPGQAEHGRHLLGLYEGVSKLRRGNNYFAASPDRITLFRSEHLKNASSADHLEQQLRRTVLHEIAHHLGIDDDHLQEIGWG